MGARKALAPEAARRSGLAAMKEEALPLVDLMGALPRVELVARMEALPLMGAFLLGGRQPRPGTS